MNDNKLTAIMVASTCLMMSIIFGTLAYQDGQTDRAEIQLKIEQEKTKQLFINGKDSTETRYNQDN